MYDVYWFEVADDVTNLGIKINWSTFPESENSNDNNQKIMNKTEDAISNWT